MLYSFQQAFDATNGLFAITFEPFLTVGGGGGGGSTAGEGNEPGQEPPTSTIDTYTELVHGVRIVAGGIH